MPIPQVPIGEKINRLGLIVDSWADVIEKGAEKGAAISDEFDHSIQVRDLPNVLLTRTEMTADGANIGRTVHLLKTIEGHSLAVYFGAQGKDLLISWDLYIKPKLNLLYLAILLGGTAAITLTITLITGILGASFISFIFAWVARFFNWLLPVILGTALVGLFLRGNSLAFFLNLPSKFSEDDLTGLILVAHQSILKAVEAAGLDAGKLRVKKGFRGGNWFRKI